MINNNLLISYHNNTLNQNEMDARHSPPDDLRARRGQATDRVQIGDRSARPVSVRSAVAM